MDQLRLFASDIASPVLFRDGRIDGPLGTDAPIIVSLGVGEDSVAMLVEMRARGVRPDAIVTALVGSGEYGNEHPRFYLFLPALSRWLERVGFPPVAFVQYRLQKRAKHYHYESLAGNCIANRTLPSLAFRRNHSCSLKWKGKEIDKWVTSVYGGQPCYRLIGYDCTETGRPARFVAKTQKGTERDSDVFVYPLQIWGMNRRDCIETTIRAGLPSPGKSSCVFCPSMKADEIDTLDDISLWLIVIIEAHASPNLKVIKGLWGHDGRMTDYILLRGLLPADMIGQVWGKWASAERPPELRDNPNAVADAVLFADAQRLADITAKMRR